MTGIISIETVIRGLEILSALNIPINGKRKIVNFQLSSNLK